MLLNPKLTLPDNRMSGITVPVAILAADECNWFRNDFFERNYIASVYRHPQAALQAIIADPPDIILVNLDNGINEFLSFINSAHNEPSLAPIPIILVGENLSPSQIHRGINAGATDYVSSLDDPRLIATRIEMVLTRQRQVAHQAHIISELRAQKQNYERMVRMVIHDLKHPITNIAMIGELLRSLDEPEMQATILNSLDAASNSLQEILDDFATASNIHVDQTTLIIVPLDVQRLLDEVVLANFASALRKRMQITIVPTTLRVRGDWERLRRVLNNLVSNAIKYAPSDSTITIETTTNGQNVRISVSDEGPGIPPEEHHLLFQEFGKASPRPTGEETSTGLGLWIVKSLIEVMRGQVGLDNEKSRGATFWIELPAASSPASFKHQH